MLQRMAIVRVAVLCLLAGVLALVQSDRAVAQSKENERADDQAAIRKRTQEFLDTLAKGEAKAVAAFWTDSGEYVHGDELTIRGRAAIEKAYAEHLKKKQPGTLELKSSEIR